MWPFGEENIYQAIAEVYLPLLTLLDELADEQLDVAITLSITPILAEQLVDADIQQGFVTYCHDRMARLQTDIERFKHTEQAEPLALAQRYHSQYEQLVKRFVQRYKSNLITALRGHAEAGRLELVASAATHALLPLLLPEPWLKLQVELGVATFKRLFGQAPAGFWLPECGYRPAKLINNQWHQGLEATLEAQGIRYFFTEYHAIEVASSQSLAQQQAAQHQHARLHATPSPHAQDDTTTLTTHQAYRLANSALAFIARNNAASFQVWSASYGYPGDGAYREFHKSDEQSGAKYWRLTDKTLGLGDKTWYQPDLAQAKVAEHAQHFVDLLLEQAQQPTGLSSEGSAPIINVAFDTELFGHWWYEGTDWLKAVLKLLAQQPQLKVSTASAALAQQPPQQALALPECTWGEGGQFWVWQNQQTDWIAPTLEALGNRLLTTFAKQRDTLEANPLLQRVALQAIRELLIMQASDWPFLITTYQAKDYAIKRLEGHRANLWQLLGMLDTAHVDAQALKHLESLNNPFAWLTWHMAVAMLGLPQASVAVAQP
jgi:1,4-alpha-glucan branching enzyme